VAPAYLQPDRLGPLGPGLLPFQGGLLGFDTLLHHRRGSAPQRRTLKAVRADPALHCGLETLTRAPEPMPLPHGHAPLRFDRPLIQAILNVTPDSFSDGGRFASRDAALAQAKAMIAAGADTLDIGGESTRPGAEEVPVQQELDRVMPVIEALTGCPVPISIDTRKAQVMRAAVAAGAAIINDVSGLSFDPAAAPAAAELACPVIVCHAQGTPQTMQTDPHYDHVLLDIFDWCGGRLDALQQQGVPRHRIVLDPGIGFGKTTAHNLTLLNGLALFGALGRPLLVGASRKRFIAALSAGEPADRRLGGSLAAAIKAFDQGAAMVRVHDVEQTVQARAVWQALVQASRDAPWRPSVGEGA